MSNTLLIKNIRCLVQADIEKKPFTAGPLKGLSMDQLPQIENAWLLIEDGLIKDYGEMATCPMPFSNIIDAGGKFVFPCWVDSHTHTVFAESRETEFVSRIKGLSYVEIAQQGGGILNSAKKLRKLSEEVLLERAYERVQRIISYGTGALEIKSGYGLDLDSEIKMLRVIQRLKQLCSIDIKATFLGAHALPLDYKSRPDEYLDIMLNEALPRIVTEGLADYIDIFCEKGFFSESNTNRVLEAGLKYGLKGKIHTNQFNSMGGIEAAIRHNALSVDHLEVVTEEEIEALKNSNLIAALLPSAPFFLNDHFPPARKLLDADIPVALATDFNPGSSPSSRMSFVLSLACIKMKMTPEEAINAATRNGAYALELQEQYGSIEIGKVGSVIITKPMPSLAYLPYAFGDDLIERVIIKGQLK